MCQDRGCHENSIIGRFAQEHDALINLSGGMVRAHEEGEPDRAHVLAREARALLWAVPPHRW